MSEFNKSVSFTFHRIFAAIATTKFVSNIMPTTHVVSVSIIG